MTASALKYQIEQAGQERYFFTRKTMRFFGDTMRNYGVRKMTIDTLSQPNVSVYELFRRRPVKHGNQGSAYFRQDTYGRAFVKKA
jgi:hypothetical protein